MTSANRTGVSSGTRSSRGVRTLSAKRRRTSMLSARALRGEVGARGRDAVEGEAGVAMVTIGSPFESGGGQTAAREAEVHVIEGGATGGELGRVEPDLVDREHGRLRGRPVQRDGERATERERVVGRHPVRAQSRQRGGRVPVDSELEHLGAKRPQQRLRRVEGDDPTRVHDRDAIAESLGLVEVVRREDDGHLAPPTQSVDEIEKLVPDEWIQTDGRLVEKQDLGLGEEGPRELQSTALPPAVARDRPVDDLSEPERVDAFPKSPCRGPGIQTPQSCMNLEVASPGERPVDDRFLEDDGAHASGLEGLAGHLTPSQARASRGRCNRPREHADGGRFAGTVRTQQPEDLTGSHLEVDLAHCLDAARIRLGQSPDFDCKRCHGRLHSKVWTTAEKDGRPVDVVTLPTPLPADVTLQSLRSSYE